ncbi:MAG: MutH/Sau3AI family endonuclease [bacterium]|nr:MutH/Sau3AI family endonuclease [bacterium]
MAILDLSKIKTAKELEERARQDLEGKTLSEIADWVSKSDKTSRVLSKASVGYVVEEGYFGLGKNNSAEPDLATLGVELKTSPLKKGRDGKLRVKEPLSLNIINYIQECKNENLSQSSLYKKNRKILFVWYVHDDGLRSAYVIKYVFLWEMTPAILAELEPDYQAILQMIRKGEAHHIHQHQHQSLTLCPKHGGTFRDPNDKKSKTKQPYSDAPAEIRAFRLKNSYMNLVIHRYLSKFKKDKISEFVTPKNGD